MVYEKEKPSKILLTYPDWINVQEVTQFAAVVVVFVKYGRHSVEAFARREQW